MDGSAAAFAYPRIVHIGDTSERLDRATFAAISRYVPSAWSRATTSTPWRSCDGRLGGRRRLRQGLSGWEDYDLWCRFAEIGLYGSQVAEDLALYRIHVDRCCTR